LSVTTITVVLIFLFEVITSTALEDGNTLETWQQAEQYLKDKAINLVVLDELTYIYLFEL
jgi:ATP:corrinoid adenosyltransferase